MRSTLKLVKVVALARARAGKRFALGCRPWSQHGGFLTLSAFAAGIIGIALTLTFSFASRNGVAAVAPYQMEMDADGGTAGVQATRTVTGTATFSVGIQITAAQAAYNAYAWEIEFPSTGLSLTGGFVENTSATTLTTCVVPFDNSGAALTPGDTVINGGCITLGASTTSFVGQTTAFNMQCVSNGVFSLRLLSLSQDPLFGSDILAVGNISRGPATIDASISCSGIAGGPTNTPTAGAGSYQMEMDADGSTAGVQATRNVSGTAVFSVGIQITAAQAAYEGYQWEIEFPPAGLSFIDGSVVENTIATTLALCAPTFDNSAAALTPGDTVIGRGAGCITLGAATSFIGQTTTYNMQCVSNGVYSLRLLSLSQEPTFGSDILSGGGISRGPATVNASISCSGLAGGPTNTPTATATATARGHRAHKTPKPTHTPRPTRTASGAPYQMKMDADGAAAGVQTTRNVTGTAAFSVGIQITAAAQPYSGYGWEIEFAAGLSFAGGVVENTAATAFTICSPPLDNSGAAITPGDTVIGGGAGCFTLSGPTSFVGQTTTFNMQCLADGVFSLKLLSVVQDPLFGSDMFTNLGNSLGATTANATTITCIGTGGAAAGHSVVDRVFA